MEASKHLKFCIKNILRSAGNFLIDFTSIIVRPCSGVIHDGRTGNAIKKLYWIFTGRVAR